MPTTPVAPSAVPDFPALSDRTTYNAKAYAWAVHMDTVYPAEMQALATVTHGNAVEAAASAVTASGYVATVEASASAAAASVTLASDQAAIAQGAANNKGNWSALTGALNMPAAVVHNGKIWVLRVNLADVTTSTPGANSDWLEMAGATESAYLPITITSKDITLPVTNTASILLSDVIDMGAGVRLHITCGGLYVCAVVYDGATDTWGAATLIRTLAAYQAYAGGILCSAGKVLLCTGDGATAMQTVVLSVTGTSITVGAPVSTTVGGSAALNFYIQAVGASFVVAYGATNGGGLLAITVSDTTPTVGAIALTSLNCPPSVHVLDSTRVLVAYAFSEMRFLVCTISGSTITLGTHVVAAHATPQTRFIGGLTTGRFFVVYAVSSTSWGAVIAVSGATVTVSTVQLHTTVYPAAAIVQGAQVLVGGTAGVNVLTDSAGTAVAGTQITGYTELVAFDSASMYLRASSIYRRIGISGNNPILTAATTASPGTSFDGWGASSMDQHRGNLMCLESSLGEVFRLHGTGALAPVFSGTDIDPIKRAALWKLLPNIAPIKDGAVRWLGYNYLASGANQICINKVEVL